MNESDSYAVERIILKEEAEQLIRVARELRVDPLELANTHILLGQVIHVLLKLETTRPTKEGDES